MPSRKTTAAKKTAPRRKSTSGKRQTYRTEAEENFSFGLTGAAVLLMLASALIFILNIVGVKAVLLNVYSDFVKGLIGVGYFVLPVALIAVAWILLVEEKSRRRPSQVISILAFPTLIGTWGHLFTASNVGYLRKSLGIARLYEDGKTFQAGGVISGLIGEGIAYLISPVGLGILLAIFTAIAGIYIVRLDLREVFEAVFTGLRSRRGQNDEDLKAKREEKRAARLKRIEEEEKLRAEERQRAAEEHAADDFRIPAIGEKPDPRDYDLPLGKAERERPKGIFSFGFSGGKKTGEPEPSPEEKTGVPFEDATVSDKKPAPAAPSAGSVIDIPLDGEKTPAKTEAVPTPLIRAGSASLDKTEIEILPAPAGTEENAIRVDPSTGEVLEIPQNGEKAGEGEKITDNMIYDYDGKGESPILEESGIDMKEIQRDETKVSASLRPNEEEKKRQAAERAKHVKPPYQFPPITLLHEDTSKPSPASNEEIQTNATRLVETLQSFNIDAHVTNVIRGPSITRYEVQLRQGIRFSRLTSLSDDIALALGAQAVRIAAIPDKVSIGIEVPNKNVKTVFIRDCLSSDEFKNNPSRVTFALGKDITGKVMVWDIAKLPHMLVAGTTGSGKSVCINSLLVSLIYKSSPEDVKFIMIDPKIIELGVYNGIPHLMTPVVTDPKKAAGTLQWAVYEMMHRYKMMADFGVRSIFEYNAIVKKRQSMPEEEGDEDRKTLPQIVIVIDELADLMLTSPREVEESICQIAQMARAAGMHLIIATQRPSADVITGLMKANIPSRIAFAVSSAMESRIILDSQGAERLVGKGDMLFSPIGATRPFRIQGCFISSDEIEAVCEHAKKYGAPEYDESIMEHITKAAESMGKGAKKAGAGDEDADDADASGDDPLLNDAIDSIMEMKSASTSGLQRRLKIGYARAGRLIDLMEEKGIVGPFQGSKPRDILLSEQAWQEMKMNREE